MGIGDLQRRLRRVPGWAWLAATAAGAYELAINLPEAHARADAFRAARAHADARGKPLLNVGCPGAWKGSYSDAAADVCLDLDADKLAACLAGQPTWGNVLDLPFPDRMFGAATCFHVLEHLETIADAARAIAELERVADRVWVLVPGHSLWAIVHSDHRLWLDRQAGGYTAMDRQTGAQRFLAVRDPQPPQEGRG